MEVLKNTTNDNNDHIYYNMNINRREVAKNILAEFSENRTNPILNVCDNYEMSVVRFSVPTINIPIFLWKPNEWFISINYLNNTFTREVPFIANQTGTNAPKFFGDAIWHYQDFIDCINACLLLCFQDFAADPVYLTIPIAERPTEPPHMTYNGETKLLNIYFPLEYDTTKINPIYIYFSSLLFGYFPAFQNYGKEINPLLSHHFKVKNNRNNKVVVNGVDYYKLTEEWNEQFLWNDFQRLIFETDSIPVANELISGQKNITRKVLTDFEPLSGTNDQSNIQFYPQSNIRVYQMISGLELRQLDMRVFWQSKDGSVYPLYISGYDFLTIKLYFKKKGVMLSELGIF